MGDFGAGLVELIDSRVDVAKPRLTKMGTVTGRDTTGARAMVTFDGSSGVAQPVKCFESVVVDVGDRVGLVRFESDWIIVGNYTLRSLADAQLRFEWPSAVGITSATFVDMPNSPSITFTKMRDATNLQIQVALSLYSTAITTVFHIGVRLISQDLTTVNYDEDVLHRAVPATANSHFDCSGRITTALQPAGVYTATARWLRTSGAGTLTVDSNDSISMHIREVGP